MPTPWQQLFRNFSWGEWDALYLWPEWGYRAWLWLDTMTLENGFKIANELWNPIFWTSDFNWEFVSFNPHKADTFASQMWQNWYIYSWNLTPITLSTTPSAYNRILWWGRLHRPVDNKEVDYVFTQVNSFWVWQVHRIEPDYNGINYNLATFTLWEDRTTVSQSDRLPVLSLPWRIVFAYWNTIFEFDKLESVKVLVTLPESVDIEYISVYLDTFKIFANRKKTSGTSDWYIAYWDWINNLLEQYVYFENSPIRNVIPNWESEMVVFWWTFTSDLYLVQGLSRQLVRSNVEVQKWNTRILWKVWDAREGIVYFTWYSKFSNDESCLYSFWNFYPWQPFQLQPWIKIPYDLLDIKGIQCEEQYIDIYVNFVVWDNWKRFRYLLANNVRSGTQAEMILFPIQWVWLQSEKQLKAIDIAYNLQSTSNTIKVFVRTWWPYNREIDNGWIEACTINDNTKRNRKLHPTEITALNLWYWHELEVKLQLNRVWWVDSPVVYWVDVYFDDDLR